MDKQEKREETIKKIIASFGQDGDVSRTVLVGEAGIGKTWLAQQVSERVTEGTSSSSYNVFWLNLNKKIVDEKSLYENLAAQVSLFHEYEEGGNEDNEKEEDSLEILKEKITKKVFKEKKNLLLILDDEGKMTTEEHVMKVLNLEGFLKEHATLKTLVIRRDARKKEDETTTTIKVGPLSEEDLLELLRDSKDLFESYTVEDWPVLLENLCKNKEIKNPTLMSCIVSKSKGLPAAIVVLTKSLNNIEKLSAKQRNIFKELILSPKSLDQAAASKNAIDRSCYNPVLRLSYELLKFDETVKSPVIACFWHVLDFYKYSGCAYYRDLIVHWMLEGYFDPVKSVEKAYQEGHSILMEFMNRGILKKQENNMVVPEVSMSNLLDLQDCGFFGRSCLGFNRVYGGDKTKGLGRIILIDDMIQTIQSKKEKIKTLIVSGNRLCREVPGKFFEQKEMEDLEVVVLFDPTFKDLVSSLSKLKKLRVLVIRDCNLIIDIDELRVLQGLHVLEVSGASFLTNIPDDFFKSMSQLQSLNLSGLPIKSSPSTIENLSELRCFILRDCSELQDLPNFNVATRELEVIDICGARKLESYFDRVKDWKDYRGKNKNFAHLQRLEHLDFSETKIIRLPVFHLKDLTNDYSTMPSLTRLLLRNCTRLTRLPQLKPLTKLQILDVSGATKLVEMLEECLEDKKELRILDISETPLPELGDTINDVINLSQLLVRNCSKITTLPSIENLTHLEVFDVSGCNNLKKIDGSFGKMSFLHKVNISGTNLSELPNNISELSNIKELIIRDCSNLKALPNLEKLIHLEILDVSGCTQLVKIDGSFEKMSYLREVNLSGTNLGELPNKISELSNIKELIIKNCSKLKTLPNLEKLIHLEILDVSGCTELAKIEGSFEKMSYLREVNLSGTKLTTFPELPNESILSSSKLIVLEDSTRLERDGWSQIKESSAMTIRKIIASFGQDGIVSRTVLVGEAGIGKTWLAQQVSERVTEGTSSSSYTVFWLNLNKQIVDEKSLYENLAAQVSLFHEYEEGGNEDNEKEEDSLEILKEKITKKVFKEKKNLLLILDDEGKMTTEEHVMKVLNLEGFLKEHATLKTLVIRRDARKKEDETTTTIKVGPLSEEDLLELLRDSKDLFESYTVEDWPVLLENLCKNKEIKNPTLMSCIVSKSKGLPAAIVVLTKSLNNIEKLSAKQRNIFKELILSPKSLDQAAASKNAIDRSCYNPVLRLSYELLKFDETVKSPVIACFWHVLDFYKYSGCAYYRDLIVHWMLEGYFDPVKSVEKAYQEGHSILMEFMNRGILKKQENNMVVPEVSMSNLLDLQDCGFFGRSCLGFNRVYGGDKTKGLGRIILIDDMIQTIQSKKEKIKTLIVSGNRLRREVHGKFFEQKEMEDLEVVVLFDPTFKNLVSSLSKLKKLRVLVIRDCDLIKNIDVLTVLQGLHVLEVSGASFLNNIPDDFFKNMSQLQSLNLSGLPIESSPSTIESLSELRCFILRDCSELQDLPNFIVATRKLEVIDIRGAQKLESYFDRVKDWKDYKGKNKNFAQLQRLEYLDFSETKIIRLPIFHLKDSSNDYSTMPLLTRLLLRNCTRLRRLPQLKPLTKLQILDVSGATKLVEMLEVCLKEKKELRILDISETPLPELADTINDVINLNQLLVRNCSKITWIPIIENLTHLEVFDVSGCNNLERIDGSFGKMSYLHKVNLSGTKLTELPNKISELSNIKEFIITNCSKIKTLPNLQKLIHLEIFDVSGCTELDKIDGSFEKMSYLREVNLSGTNLGELPNKISELSNIKELIIKNCSKLKTLPNLEKLIHLEIFDVSGCTELAKIEGSFEKMSYLREVNLSGTKLNTFPELPKESILSSPKLNTFPELPKESILSSPKLIVLADSTRLEQPDWSQVKKCLAMKSEGSSFSNVTEKTRENSENLVHQGKRYKVLDPESPLDIIDINESMELGKEDITKADYISVSENESKCLSSIFDKFQMSSVKGCWVERCKNMDNLLTSSSTTLETLWISNLPLLKTLYTTKERFIFKNLKKISIDCCPNIETLFPDIPDNLETLRVTFCDQLEKLFEAKEVVELPSLRKLYLLDSSALSEAGLKFPNLEVYTAEKCPNWKTITKEELRLGTRRREDQSHKNVGTEIQNPTLPTKATEEEISEEQSLKNVGTETENLTQLTRATSPN